MSGAATRRALLLAAGAGAAWARPARAQAWPSRPIRFVVPYPPGGSTDVVGRLIGQGLQERLGQTVVIENRGGATATIGSQMVATAAPDGHTLLLSNIASQAIAATLFRALPYDPVRDFTHVALLVTNQAVFVCNPSFEARTLGEMVALSARRDGGLDMASSGSGSSNHLLMARFAGLTGARVNHVPYRGAGPAMTDVIAGNVPMMSDTLASALPHIRAGSVRALAVSGPERSPLVPDVPTFREQGVDLVSQPWYGLSGPAGMPAPVVARLWEAVRSVLAAPDTRARLSEIGSDPGEMGPDRYGRFVAEEVAAWAPVVRASGATAE